MGQESCAWEHRSAQWSAQWFHGALGRAEGLLPASGPGPTTRQNWQWVLHHPGAMWALWGGRADRQRSIGGQSAALLLAPAPSGGWSVPPSTQQVFVLSPPVSCPSAQACLLTSRFPAFLPPDCQVRSSCTTLLKIGEGWHQQGAKDKILKLFHSH